MSGLQKPRDPYRGAIESQTLKGVRPDIVHEPELRRIQQHVDALVESISISGLPSAPDPSLLFGRGDSGAGPLEFITIGAGLTMVGTQLRATGGAPTFGTATVSFGAFPGKSDASVDIADASITALSKVTAWIFPGNTGDHTIDEHVAESLRCYAGNLNVGVGFTIYVRNDSELFEPAEYVGTNPLPSKPWAGGGPVLPQGGGIGTLIYGDWFVGYMVA